MLLFQLFRNFWDFRILLGHPVHRIRIQSRRRIFFRKLFFFLFNLASRRQLALSAMIFLSSGVFYFISHNVRWFARRCHYHNYKCLCPTRLSRLDKRG